ncbi:MAG: hypothetical protein K8F91_12060 [Candidatus Obscuribacterales bacterium]|nr:hypothetical protein [Candidatus Obscuribacterales bacterium]
MLNGHAAIPKRALSLLIFACFCLGSLALPGLAENTPAGVKKSKPEPAKKPFAESSGKDAKKTGSEKESSDKDDKKVSENKKDDKKKDEPEVKEAVIANVVDVTADGLVAKPKDYLGKNIKFKANFYAFSSLALNYKPAYRDPKKYISFLVLKSGKESHIPYAELKLAMLIPKDDKDPRNKLLITLKDGDTIEVTGNVFSAALDEPWVDVLKLKKLASAKKKGDADEEDEE